jgi:hypothetical protein
VRAVDDVVISSFTHCNGMVIMLLCRAEFPAVQPTKGGV